MLSMTAGLAVILSQGVSHQALAAGAALTGQVSSAEEGNMEGVVVSAKKAGSTVMVSVTTDAQGRYTFPEGRLEPGQYTLAIRAVGYDLAAPATATVAAASSATAFRAPRIRRRSCSTARAAIHWSASCARPTIRTNLRKSSPVWRATGP
jgi:hypothetical protein